MSDAREPTPIRIADVKRRFSDVLGRVRHLGERFVIHRRGTAVAALVPVEDLRSVDQAPGGVLALVGAFGDAPELADALEEIVRRRAREAEEGD